MSNEARKSKMVDTPDAGNAHEVTAPISNELPETYRGKSVEEVAKMHMELTTKLGQQGQELGALRASLDEMLAQGTPRSKGTDDQPVDFFDDPERAVTAILQRELRPYQEMLEVNREHSVKAKLDSDHPGWQQTVANGEFQKWVADSKVRLDLWKRADRLDYDAASELFSTWGSLNRTEAQAQQEKSTAVKRDRQLRAATTERGTPAIDSRKVLRRADLVELRRSNPDKYNSLLPEIKQAYAEGRVR
jgi:hypothetical protein